MFAYVGSRTSRERNARGDGITVWKVEEATGDLSLVQTVGDLVNPSFLLKHPTLPVLYTVHGDQQQVSAFRIDPATGHLSFLNRQDCGGRNPVHLALSPDARHLVISNHVSSSLVVLPVSTDGSLEPLSQLVTLEGPPGPHRVEQPFAKPHFNPFDPSGRWVLVPDKGVDRIFAFRFESGRLTPAAQAFAQAREGAGPRHLAFHPTQPWVYVINELDSTVTAYTFDPITGALQPFQVLSALDDTFTGNSRASEVEVDRSGRTLYASNRGEDSIAVFDIDPDTGRIRLRQSVLSEGRTPRFFSIDPTGRWLYVLNEDSDAIVRFDAVAASGLLSTTGKSWKTGSPVCMVFGST
ncbi:MAG: lactonase family protein [Hydrogenophaga sp.]|uniref:lactonase family protein n=1 Tax=Hydrogenophaga sp. TaxID=1904254 RepID=UPI0025B889C9|nr:lactonase family protein [Hydrogenophaga sp.]MBT9550714.1 lactonase family protein [Hydrogenophaga sp.]